jgi:MFS family permease
MMIYDVDYADFDIAFLLITAKLSDVWGLKNLLLSCAIIFLTFSMACGGAQSMVQLYADRPCYLSQY